MIGNTMTLRLVLNTNGKKIAIMIILVDDRTDVTTAYRASFGREGVSAASFTPSDFDNWFQSTSGLDLAAVEAFILGDFDRRETLTRVIKTRTEAPGHSLRDHPARHGPRWARCHANGNHSLAKRRPTVSRPAKRIDNAPAPVRTGKVVKLPARGDAVRKSHRGPIVVGLALGDVMVEPDIC